MNGNLIVALTDVAPDDLNPYKSNTLHIHTVMWPIYEALFDIDRDGNLDFRTGLALQLNPGPPLTYEFPLREGVTFSNGAPFNANSAADNLERVRTQQPASFRERILHDLIDRVQPVPGTQTLRVKLNYPKPELLFLALMTDGGSSPLGTGPFSLESQSQSQIVLRRNQRYRSQVRLDHITFRVFARPDDLVTAFNARQLDFIRDIDDEHIRQLHGASILDVAPFGLHYLGFNWGSTAFRTPAVRQAFRDTIDFKQIASKTGLRPAKGPIPPRVEAYDASTPSAPQQNRAQARTTLENECGGKITLLYNANSYYGDELAKSIETDLGSNLVSRQPQQNSSQLLEALARRGHNANDHYVFIYNWYSILPAAEIFLRPLYETGMPDNLTGYSEPLVDGVFNNIQNGKTSPADGYRDAQAKIINDMPAIFLGHSQVRHSARGASVSGLALNTQSFPVDRYAGVYA
jgi:peptide/nickel transport system substrate-binding protein